MTALFPTYFRKRGRGVRLRKSGKWGAAVPSFPATPPVFRKPVGATLTKSGKWLSFIWHPIAKIQLYLGMYNTPQEAGEVYTKKKLEIESMYPTARKKLRQRESSKWYAVYQDPITRWTSYLGSYGSAEEAAEARYRKKREFDSMEMQKVQSNAAAEEDTQEQDGTAHYNVDSDLGSDIKGNVLRLHHDNGIEQEIALACISEAGNSKITVANGDNCKEIDMDVENGEIPTLRPVIEEKFDMGVIDAYGQLIGEFSRMDDELWFV